MQDNGAGALHLDKRDYRFFFTNGAGALHLRISAEGRSYRNFTPTDYTPYRNMVVEDRKFLLAEAKIPEN